jgi:glutathione S-transferase
MGVVSALATLLCRPPPANVFVNAFVLSTKSLAPSSTTTIASILPGAVARTVSGVSLFAALGKGNGGERSNASFSSRISDMAASIFGKMGMVPMNPNIDQLLENMNIPSWESVRAQLEQQQTAEEQQFRSNLSKGYGVGSPLHKVRLFDESNQEDDIRVTFYRDSASWCPYCQKVWIALEEKKIPYRVEKINMRCYGEKPVTFQMMQPSGQIPVAVIDGTIYRQSNDILEVLEVSFLHHKSLSASAGQEMQAQSLLRLERQLFSAWMYWLTSGNGSARNRESFLQVLHAVEESLSASHGPFFLGKDISIVDIQFTPFLERMAASLLYYKGFQIRVAPNAETKYPAINRWFDAMEQLPSYQLTKSDYYTHCWDLPPQLGGCVMEPAGKIYESVVNGERRLDDATKGSWELPLQPHNGGVEPDWWWAGDEATAFREVVERISANHEAIVKFACRGAGTKGIPPVSAPLADPNALSNDAVHSAVSTVLRIICLFMLDETTRKTQEEALISLRQLILEQGGSDYTDGVVQSLAYLRDRVGVPRDMKLPASRELRAHLNWAIGTLLSID